LLVEYAETLLKKFKHPLEVCFFVNSGSEANDLALRLASRFTQGEDIIVLENAYHGTSKACMEVSPTKHKGNHHYHDDPDCMETPSFIHKVDVPDPFRGKKESKFYSDQIEDKLKNIKNLSCFICESAQGVGGQIFYPENYLKEAYGHVRKFGVRYILNLKRVYVLLMRFKLVLDEQGIPFGGLNLKE
jgi:4-aminobutyrate aminotransferase-like enzyme